MLQFIIHQLMQNIVDVEKSLHLHIAGEKTTLYLYIVELAFVPAHFLKTEFSYVHVRYEALLDPVRAV